MVAVLVRYQNCVECVGGLTDEREAPLQLPETQAGIDEDARPVGGDECHIAGTTAGQDAKLYDGKLSLMSICSIYWGEMHPGVKHFMVSTFFWYGRFGEGRALPAVLVCPAGVDGLSKCLLAEASVAAP